MLTRRTIADLPNDGILVVSTAMYERARGYEYLSPGERVSGRALEFGKYSTM